jgi:hypothetical protein
MLETVDEKVGEIGLYAMPSPLSHDLSSEAKTKQVKQVWSTWS